MPRKIEAIAKRRVFGKFWGKTRKQKHVSRRIRQITTTHGERIIIMPGVKEHEINALLPGNWKIIENHYQSGRAKKRHGTVFTAQTADSKGKKFKIQCRPIRKHYSTTHEARMLSHLQGLGFNVEQPLAIVIGKNGERTIVTRFIESKAEKNYAEVKKIEKQLKALGIAPEDLHEQGRENFVFAAGADGKIRLHIIDVEHYHAKDKKSRLHASRMLRSRNI